MFEFSVEESAFVLECSHDGLRIMEWTADIIVMQVLLAYEPNLLVNCRVSTGNVYYILKKSNA